MCTEDGVEHAKILICQCNVDSDLQAICADADKLLKRNRLFQFLYSTKDARAITDMKDRTAAARQAFQVCSRSASCTFNLLTVEQ